MMTTTREKAERGAGFSPKWSVPSCSSVNGVDPARRAPTCDDHGVGFLVERWGVSLLQEGGCQLFFIKPGERERGEGEQGWSRPGSEPGLAGRGTRWPRARSCRGLYGTNSPAKLVRGCSPAVRGGWSPSIASAPSRRRSGVLQNYQKKRIKVINSHATP